MTYFHPRDFDKNQPLIKELNYFRKFKHYVGLKGSVEKFKYLLNDFNFIDINQADNITDWSKAKRIKIK